MNFVTTPEGKMKVCGIFRPKFSIVIDVILATFIFTAISTFLRIAIVPNTLISGVAAAITFIYALLGHRSILPGFGCWVLGIKRYRFVEIDEYTGKGSLFTFRDLSANTLWRRQLLAALVLATLYTICVYGK